MSIKSEYVLKYTEHNTKIHIVEVSTIYMSEIYKFLSKYCKAPREIEIDMLHYVTTQISKSQYQIANFISKSQLVYSRLCCREKINFETSVQYLQPQ